MPVEENGSGFAMKKIRWGLIGCGDIATKRVAPALRDLPNCELVAASRARADLAEPFARQFGAGKWYADWQDLVADPEIDAVYVATPVYLHAPQTILAAEHGKHVLCEKPMALDLEQCDRMIAASRAHQTKLGIAYYRHFYPLLRRVGEIIQACEIGKVILAQINAFERFDPSPADPRYWFLRPEQAGGGPMFDFGCHRVEVLLHLLGRADRVASSVGRILFAREVEDTAVAIIEMRSGARALLSVTHATVHSQDTLDLFGSEGSIHIPVLNQGRVLIRTRCEEREECHPPHANLHLPCIDDFVRALQEGREPAVSGEVGREVASVIQSIYSRSES
jgi:predicted dehydrogenase